MRRLGGRLQRIKSIAKRHFWIHLKPRVIVVGAQKSGTTSLFHYLCEHPQIVATEEKELNYFNSLGHLKPAKRQYHKIFPPATIPIESRYSLDVSPNYMLDSESVAGKIFQYDPDTRIIMMLRDPCERAYSAWHMYKQLWIKDPGWYLNSAWVRNGSVSASKIARRSNDFSKSYKKDIAEEILVLNSFGRMEMPVVEYGMYKNQIENFYRFFPKDNLLILNFDDFTNHTPDTMSRITRFLELDKMDWNRLDFKSHFSGAYEMNRVEVENEQLKRFYVEKNKGLQELIGQKFSWMQMAR